MWALFYERATEDKVDRGTLRDPVPGQGLISGTVSFILIDCGFLYRRTLSVQKDMVSRWLWVLSIAHGHRYVSLLLCGSAKHAC